MAQVSGESDSSWWRLRDGSHALCRLRQSEFCGGNGDADIAEDGGQGSKGARVQRTETGEVKGSLVVSWLG